MSFQPSSIRFKEFGTTGAPLAAGRLYTYASGTTTHKAAYTDATLGTPQSYTTDGSGNKYITLDSRGEARVWLGSGAYTFVVTDSDGANSRTVDGVQDQSDSAKTYTDALRADLADDADGANLVAYRDDWTVNEALTALHEAIYFADDPQFGNLGGTATQCTAAIQAAMVQVSSAGGTLVIPPGAYTVNGDCGIGDTASTRVNIHAYGVVLTREATASQYTMFSFRRNMTVCGLRLVVPSA